MALGNDAIYCDLKRHRDDSDLAREYDRLIAKARDLIADNPLSTKVSLSKYAYETLKHGNAFSINKIQEFNSLFGKEVIDNDLKGKEMEFHDA